MAAPFVPVVFHRQGQSQRDRLITKPALCTRSHAMPHSLQSWLLVAQRPAGQEGPGSRSSMSPSRRDPHGQTSGAAPAGAASPEHQRSFRSRAEPWWTEPGVASGESGLWVLSIQQEHPWSATFKREVGVWGVEAEARRGSAHAGLLGVRPPAGKLRCARSQAKGGAPSRKPAPANGSSEEREEVRGPQGLEVSSSQTREPRGGPGLQGNSTRGIGPGPRLPGEPRPAEAGLSRGFNPEREQASGA